MFKHISMIIALMFAFAVPAQAESVVGDTFLPVVSAPIHSEPVLAKVTDNKITSDRSINVTGENTLTSYILKKAPEYMIATVGAGTAERPNNDGFAPFEVGWRIS